MTKRYEGEPTTSYRRADASGKQPPPVNMLQSQGICPQCQIYTAYLWEYGTNLTFACSNRHAVAVLGVVESEQLALIGLNKLEGRINSDAQP